MGKILIVEDENSVRYSLDLALSSNGYNVTTASDGVKGLSWLILTSRNPDNFDLLIVDVMMPVMNGISLLNKLRQFNIFVPTLVITGCSDLETLVKLKEIGHVDILKKPFEPDIFLKKVSQIIARKTGASTTGVARPGAGTARQEIGNGE